MNKGSESSFEKLFHEGLVTLPVKDEAVNQACSRVRVANWCDESRPKAFWMRRFMWAPAAVGAVLALFVGHMLYPDSLPTRLLRAADEKTSVNPVVTKATHAHPDARDAVAQEFQRLSASLGDSCNESLSLEEIRLRIQKLRARVLDLLLVTEHNENNEPLRSDSYDSQKSKPASARQ